MRNVGVADDARGKNTYLKCRQKSSKPVEVVAETVCHMFTIEGAKLSELREYYWYVVPYRSLRLEYTYPPVYKSDVPPKILCSLNACQESHESFKKGVHRHWSNISQAPEVIFCEFQYD
jgi:hypothetical protein